VSDKSECTYVGWVSSTSWSSVVGYAYNVNKLYVLRTGGKVW